jgi:hypothetical protein
MTGRETSLSLETVSGPTKSYPLWFKPAKVFPFLVKEKEFLPHQGTPSIPRFVSTPYRFLRR